MLHPDNFYSVIQENFIQYPNILWVPRTHGEKNFTSFIPYCEGKWMEKESAFRLASARVWMYDQEPLLPSSLNTYARHVIDLLETADQNVIQNSSFGQLLALLTKSYNIPMLCHSEQNSQELLDLQSSLTVTCYYWYHGFVARDWFRFWQYNKSLLPQDRSSAPYRFLMYARDFTATRNYRKSVVQALYRFRDMVLYDWDQRRHISPDHSAVIDIEDAKRSAVHLVLETIFDMDKLYLTEKICKPMVMGQPFIVFGPPGTLQYLRRYGFQTFDEIWTEDYDNEKDHLIRQKMILDLIERLANMSSQQFYEVYQRCLPAIDHNRRWFFSHDFMDLCWQELSNNFNTALLQQKTLLEEYPGGQFFYVMANNRDLWRLAGMKNLVVNMMKNMDQNLCRNTLQKYPIFASL